MAAFLTPIPLPGRPRRRRATFPHTPAACVAGRMAQAYSSVPLHPVLRILQNRLETGSKPGRRRDKRKVALCIEGGGMRGAVSAGMVGAIKYCGLEDAFDVVYGSSAGSIVGAYFVSRQLPVYGARIYYDVICSMPEDGQRFIDLWALRHHPYLRRARRKQKEYYGEGTRPVLLLDLLIDSVMRDQRPLDWAAFWKTHTNQPLKPVASSLSTMRAHTLDSFITLDEFLECLRASARVPGIAGNPVEINGQLYADGLLFEPIPYRSALRDGCTDVLVLRTKPDASALKATRPGIYEKHIAAPYFDMFPSLAPRAEISDYLNAGEHLGVYNEDVLRLRRENVYPGENGGPAILSITPAPDAPRVGQLESRAKVVYEGVRNGFAAAYDVLSPFADPDLDSVPSELVRTAKGDERMQRMTAGRKAATYVFSDAELAEVEKRHREARKARAEFRSRQRKRRRAAPVPSQPRNVVRARRRRRVDRARARRRRAERDSLTIEEYFFVG